MPDVQLQTVTTPAVPLSALPPGKFANLRSDQQGNLCVVQGLPERAEVVRQGNSWGAQIAESGTPFTLLITIPTTRAEIALQNGEPKNGKSYIIDRVWIKAVTSLAAANYLTILAQVIAPGTALVADGVASDRVIWSLSGKPNYNGYAKIVRASTSVGALTDKWLCIGNTILLPTTTSIAAFGEAFVYGRYVIPPGGTFALNAQEAVSGGTAIMGVEWHEVQLPLG